MTHMKSKLLIAVSILILLSLTVVGRTLAQAPVVGVTQGNEFTYNIKSYWSSNDPNATITASLLEVNSTEYYLLEVNRTEYYRVNIAKVSGPEISLHNTWRFTNGTQVERDGSVNIETTSSQGGFWAIIASNLKAGDRIHPLFGPDLTTINETIMRDYPSGKRETNHLMLDFQYYDPNDPSSNCTEHTSTYFDKQTGMLVELHDDSVYTHPNMTISVVWKISESQVWPKPNEFPFYLALSIVIVAVIAVLSVLFYRRKHVKRKPRRKPR